MQKNSKANDKAHSRSKISPATGGVVLSSVVLGWRFLFRLVSLPVFGGFSWQKLGNLMLSSPLQDTIMTP